MSDTLLITGDAMLAHDMGGGHPERPARLAAVVDALRLADLAHARWAEATPAPREALERVHDPEHLDALLALRGRTYVFDPDARTGPESIDAALLAAGAVVNGVDAVMDGEATSAFALVRPPGHHAGPTRATGFCLLNNVAVGAAHAIAAHGVERVLIADIDVHHGNGTQAIFEDRADVLFASIHEWPQYPGTGWSDERGRGAGAGHTINVPVRAGVGDDAYLAIVDEILLPAADAYEPRLVLVSAGFDGHVADPLGGFRLTSDGFAAIVRRLRDLARRHAGGRIVLALEGGYELGSLAESVVACVRVLGEP